VSNTKNIIQGFKWTAGTRLVGQIFNWGITIFVIRILTPDDYGILAISLTLAAFLIMLSEFGIGNGLVQKKKFDKPLLRKIFGLILLINFAFFSLLLISSNFISVFYDLDEIKEVLVVQSFQFLLLSFTVIPDARLRFDMRFKSLSLVTLVSGMIGGAATLSFALNDFGYWSLIWGDYFRIVSLIIMLQILSPSLMWPNFYIRNTEGVAKFGLLVFLNRIFFFIYSRVDVLIVGKYFSTSTTGLYTVAKDLATLPMTRLASSINIVAFSGFSHFEEKKAELARYYTKSLSILSSVSFPIFIGISSVAPELVPTVLGDKWIGIILVLQLISASVPFRVLNLVNVPLLDGIGKPEQTLKYTLIALILYTPLFWFAANLNILAVAIVWAVVSPIYFYIVLVGIKRIIPIPMISIGKNIVIPLILSVIMFFAVRFFASLMLDNDLASGLLLLCLEIAIGAIVYSILMIIFQKGQLKNIVSLVKT